MGNSKFLEYAKNFDDNYLVDEFFRKHAQEEAQKNEQTIKEFLSNSETMPLEMYSQLDYESIKAITINNNNAFSPFYNLDDTQLNYLFIGLHTVSLFLKYFNELQFDRLRKYEQREVLSKKYLAVFEDLKILKVDNEKIYQILKERMQSLNNTPTITQRRILEHLLYTICLVMNSTKNTRKITNITNRIIEDYYCIDNISFSEKTDINNFSEYHYSIESQGTNILYHSQARD